MTILSIFFLIFLITFSACLSGSETALFSLPSYSVSSFRNSSDPKKQLIHTLLRSPRDLLVTIMMLNVFANILVQNTVSSIFGDLSNWTLKVGVPLLLTLFFGEIIPKSLALPNNNAIAPKVAPILFRIQRILGPVRKFFTSVTSFISHFMFFFLKKEEEVSLEELEHILMTSSKREVLQEEEVELLKGYLDLKNSLVKEHIRPRDEILYYDIHDPLDNLYSLLTKEELSRVPVCDGDLEKIIGIISVRRLFFYKERIQKAEDLIKIIKKPHFVPESMSAWNLLEDLREMRENFAIAVDEYGSISGIVTQEDLIESVVGEINDRRDKKQRYTRSGRDVVIASGKFELSEFEDLFHIPLSNPTHMVTLGGWLTEQLGDIPTTGAKYVTDDFLFYVLSADPTRVRRIYIRRLHGKKRGVG